MTRLLSFSNQRMIKLRCVCLLDGQFTCAAMILSVAIVGRVWSEVERMGTSRIVVGRDRRRVVFRMALFVWGRTESEMEIMSTSRVVGRERSTEDCVSDGIVCVGSDGFGDGEDGYL